jgi:hypothetical protein
MLFVPRCLEHLLHLLLRTMSRPYCSCKLAMALFCDIMSACYQDADLRYDWNTHLLRRCYHNFGTGDYLRCWLRDRSDHLPDNLRNCSNNLRNGGYLQPHFLQYVWSIVHLSNLGACILPRWLAYFHFQIISGVAPSYAMN